MSSEQIRASKKQRIVNFFQDNLHKDFDTMTLHMMFGTSFRARVSDINLDPTSPIVIKNRLVKKLGSENSFYYAKERTKSEESVVSAA